MKSVYFARAVGGHGPVKIGLSKDPRGRCAYLSRFSPYVIELLATMPGDLALERRLQAHFAATQSHQEWFCWTPDLQAMIAAVRCGEFNAADLPPAAKPFHPRKYGWSEEERASRAASREARSPQATHAEAA